MDFRDGPQPAFPWLLLGFFALSCADSSPDPEATTQVQAEVAPEAQATPPPVEEVPEEPEVREPLVFDLIVSEDIQQTIVPLSKSVYGEEELDETFALLRKRGDAYCAVLDGAEDPGDRTAHAFVAPNKYRTLRYACRGCKDNVRLGCWNFFRMNDRSPQRDMQLVKTLWPEENYDCYAVGMVQPYMMHDILQCSTLTTLDFDWRIQDAHRQLLQAYRDGKVIDQGALEAVLGQVTIGWIAHSETPRPSHPAWLGTFCSTSQRETCIDALLGFQETFDQIDRVQLDLAALHEASFLRTDTTKVLYLSNALEEIYTTEEEFQELMAQLEASLDEGQKAILIHHVGSYANFGLYEVEKAAEGLKITTTCRDPYTATAENRTSDTYEIGVDALSDSSDIPTCRSLIEE